MIPSLSRDDNTRSQEQGVLGHCFQSQVSPYENFRESPRTGNKGTRKSGNDKDTTEKIDMNPQDQV